MKYQILKTSLCFYLVCLLSTLSLGQNYRPFLSGKTHHFLANSTLHSIKVDSVRSNGADSVFFLNALTRAENDTFPGNGCPYNSLEFPAFSCWHDNYFGNQMIEKPGGTFLFLFSGGDTVFLQTQFPLNTPWQFLSDTSLTASIVQRYQGTWFGVTDSALTIAVSNGDSITLLQNGGIFESADFYYLVADTTPVHITARRRADQPGFLDFFNFNVGDQFGYHRLFDAVFSIFNEWNRYTVLSKTMSPAQDQVTYQFHHEWLFSNLNSGVSTQGGGIDTVTISYSGEGFEPYLIGGRAFSAPSQAACLVLTNELVSAMNGRESFEFSGYFILDSCNETLNLIPDGGWTEIYTLGLGRTFWGNFNMAIDFTQLECYSVGGETWGNCLPFSQLVSVGSPEISGELLVLPNPSAGNFNFQCGESDTREIAVYNAAGQQVYETREPVRLSHFTLELSHLPEGIYWLCLTSETLPASFQRIAIIR